MFRVVKAESNHITDARKLQADMYLYYGNVYQHQINNDGHLNSKTDPYYKKSQYFVAIRGKAIIGSVRLIRANKVDLSDLQIAKEIDIYKATQHNHLDNKNTVEVSALVKRKGVSRLVPMMLLRKALNYSISNGYEYWVMTVSYKPYIKLKKQLVGSLVKIGKKYKIGHGNNIVVPCFVDIGILLDASDKNSPMHTSNGIIRSIFYRLILFRPMIKHRYHAKQF